MNDRTVPRGKRNNVLWSDDELLAAVESYTYMLRLQRNGVHCTERMATPLRGWGPLANRNAASIRYRMRNISAVLRDVGAPILDIYTPAEQVGAGVRERLKQMLVAHPSFGTLRQDFRDHRDQHTSTVRGPEEAILALQDLRRKIDDLGACLGGLGHNNPPEAIDPLFGPQDILQVQEDIDRLELSLRQPNGDTSTQRMLLDRIICFGLKISVWTGQRLTKFVDAALITAAPVVVAKATDVVPSLIKAVHLVAQSIGQ